MKNNEKNSITERLEDYNNLISKEMINGIRKGETFYDRDIIHNPNIYTHTDLEAIRIRPGKFPAALSKLWQLIEVCPRIKMIDLKGFKKEKVLLGKNIVDKLDQLDIIDLSGLKLNYDNSKLKPTLISLDQLFLAWGLTHGNCEGLITDGAELTNFQVFLKQSDSLQISEILAKAKQDDGWKGLLESTLKLVYPEKNYEEAEQELLKIEQEKNYKEAKEQFKRREEKEKQQSQHQSKNDIDIFPQEKSSQIKETKQQSHKQEEETKQQPQDEPYWKK